MSTTPADYREWFGTLELRDAMMFLRCYGEHWAKRKPHAVCVSAGIKAVEKERDNGIPPDRM